jgi:hypothetical protein
VSTDFKQTLWKTADKLRAQMDPGEYISVLHIGPLNSP